MNANVLLLLSRLLDAFPVPAGADGAKGTAGTKGTAGAAEPVRPVPVAQPVAVALRVPNKAEGEEEGQAARPNLTGRTALLTAAGSRPAPGTGRGEESLTRLESGGPGPVFAGATASPPDTAILLPLALKSPLFREAGFYLVLHNPEEKKNPNPEQNTALTLLLVLKTANLGILRLFFLHCRDNLQLSWLTQTEAAKEYLKNGFPELEAELSGTGYANVTMDIRVLPEKAERETGAPYRPGQKAANRAFRTFDWYT